jgi:small redox-active disulfide protein 2
MKKINSIQVLGSGCSTCKKLFELTKEVASSLHPGVEVEYVNDFQKIIELGVMSSPVLTINGQAVLVGNVFSLGKIKELLIANSQEKTEGDINNPSDCIDC